LVEKMQLVNRPADHDELDWAKTRVALTPVYYHHNYVLGHLASAQLRNHLEKHVIGGPFYEHEK